MRAKFFRVTSKWLRGGETELSSVDCPILHPPPLLLLLVLEFPVELLPLLELPLFELEPVPPAELRPPFPVFVELLPLGKLGS